MNKREEKLETKLLIFLLASERLKDRRGLGSYRLCEELFEMCGFGRRASISPALHRGYKLGFLKRDPRFIPTKKGRDLLEKKRAFLLDTFPILRQE